MTLLERFLMNIVALEGLPATEAASKKARIEALKCKDASPDSDIENILLMYVGGIVMLRDKDAYAEYQNFEGTDREFLIKLTEAEEE